MRNARVMTVLFLTLTLMPMISTTARAHHDPGPCDIHWRRAYYDHGQTGPIADLIRCAVGRWPVAGGVTKALSVARCESGLRPDADAGVSEGLYQHVKTYWPARADRWLWPAWQIRPSIWNARAQAIVTMRMVHAWGWGAWSCA